MDTAQRVFITLAVAGAISFVIGLSWMHARQNRMTECVLEP